MNFLDSQHKSFLTWNLCLGFSVVNMSDDGVPKSARFASILITIRLIPKSRQQILVVQLDLSFQTIFPDQSIDGRGDFREIRRLPSKVQELRGLPSKDLGILVGRAALRRLGAAALRRNRVPPEPRLVVRKKPNFNRWNDGLKYTMFKCRIQNIC